MEDSVQRRWGNHGYAIHNKLIELLTDAEEHYLDLSATASMELFMGYMQTIPDTVLQVMNSLANLKFIDSELWYDYRVVWCEQLVDKMLASVYSKREGDPPQRPKTELLERISGNPAQNALFPGISESERVQKEVKVGSKGNKNGDSTAEHEPLEFYYATRRASKRRKLTGRSLWWFKIFWQCYDYKYNRADAVGAWLDLEWPGGTTNDDLARWVCSGGIFEEKKRWEKVDRGQTPIYAQGWLSSNRFEDYEGSHQRMLKRLGVEVMDSKLANKVSPDHYAERPTNWK